MIDILYDFVSLIFPNVCYACRTGLVKGEKVVCTDCRIKLPYTNLHQQSGDHDPYNPVSHRLWGKVPAGFVLPYLHFKRAGRVQRLLHELKYRGASEVGTQLGEWYGYDLAENGFQDSFDLIVPVPLHPRKMRERGYNQAACFADGLSSALNIPQVATALKRIKDSDTQTLKNREERWQNVDAIFDINEPEVVRGKRVLLVDDVITTGATLEVCAALLWKAGASAVSVAAIAAAE